MAAPSPRVTFYTRQGCTLCDRVLPYLQSLCTRLKLGLAIVDIDNEPQLIERFGHWVPVVEIDGRVRLRGIISLPLLRRELEIATSCLPTKPSLRIAIAILFNRQRQMLVNCRPEGSYYGGWWEWPGGKCEIGESPINCARRELMEEIGVSSSNLSLWKRVTHDYPERQVRLHVFRGEVDDASEAKSDALEHRWLYPKEVLALQFLEANRELLSEICDEA